MNIEAEALNAKEARVAFQLLQTRFPEYKYYYERVDYRLWDNFEGAKAFIRFSYSTEDNGPKVSINMDYFQVKSW